MANVSAAFAWHGSAVDGEACARQRLERRIDATRPASEVGWPDSCLCHFVRSRRTAMITGFWAYDVLMVGSWMALLALAAGAVIAPDGETRT